MSATAIDIPTALVKNTIAKSAAFVRTGISLMKAHGRWIEAGQLAADEFKDTPQVRTILKSPVTGAGLSSALASSGAAAGFMDLLGTESAVAKLRENFYPGAFRENIPLELTAATSSFCWVREYAPVPMGRPTFGNTTLDVCKLGSFTAYTRELLEFSGGDTEAIIRQTMLEAAAFALDFYFLNPDVPYAANSNPASVTNGCTVRVSTGSSEAAIKADLSAMCAAVVGKRSPHWVMSADSFYFICGAAPTLVNDRRELMHIPVVLTQAFPKQIVLLDAKSIVFADGGLDLNFSEEASGEFESTPAVGEQSPLSAVSNIRSFWQANLVGLRVLHTVSWYRRATTSVCRMDTSY